MKMLAMLMLVAGLGLLSGCLTGTPGYTAEERQAQIFRNFGTDMDQTSDDIDHMLLLRPAGTLSGWNIYHRQ